MLNNATALARRGITDACSGKASGNAFGPLLLGMLDGRAHRPLALGRRCVRRRGRFRMLGYGWVWR
jgi:hypothetical protein